MAGTINLALSQQFDMDGEPLSGGLLYCFIAGTTTPQSAFQDTALTIAYPNPITLDASGRVPMFYLADGSIKIRLTDKNGVTIIAADQLLVIGPSAGGGGGGGGGVDVTTVLATGDIKTRYGTGTLDGFVRCNGLTIGQTGSSATELAGPKAQALYEYLWAFPNIALDGATKGATANADFLALKRMVLPDLRGRVIVGLDDMGAAPANRVTAAFFGASGVLLGNVGGDEKHALVAASIPGHTHGVTVSGTTGFENATITHNFSWGGTTSDVSADHTHFQDGRTVLNQGGGSATAGSAGAIVGGTTGGASNGHTHTYSGSSTTGGQNQNHQHSFGASTTTDTGAGLTGSNHPIVQPAMVLTIYIKL